ncbi:MAG: helix-turn-helix domain-containing protein, partial [Eisenbergiella sp.]
MRAGRKGSDYGKLVKKRLIDLGMTQAELAEMIGVGRPY